MSPFELFVLSPFGIGGFFLIPLVTFLLTLWVIYDTLVVQEDMHPVEIVVWIALAFILPLVGPLVYYILVKRMDRNLLGEGGIEVRKAGTIDELGKLHDLKESGAISEEEYEELKEDLLEGFRG